MNNLFFYTLFLLLFVHFFGVFSGIFFPFIYTYINRSMVPQNYTFQYYLRNPREVLKLFKF